MGKESRKQITFDLSQKALSENYPHTAVTTNIIFYKAAYKDISRFMKANNFEHRQFSVYASKIKMTTTDVVILMQKLALKMPWLYKCVKQIDVTNIGAQHSLIKTLEEANEKIELISANANEQPKKE